MRQPSSSVRALANGAMARASMLLDIPVGRTYNN
jgi:hypothetical protein